MSVIIQKWSSLKKNERLLLLYGLPLILGTVLYFYLWLPYNQSIHAFRQQITTVQEDITWLKQMSLQIKQLKSGAISNASFKGSLINIVDKSIKQNKLNKSVNVLEKSGKDNVVVKLDNINFDVLIKLIAYLNTRYGISVKAIDIQRTDDNSKVTSRIILKKS